MALAFAGHVKAAPVVHDRMDERGLHGSKRRPHPRARLFPSSVDAAHLRRVRLNAPA